MQIILNQLFDYQSLVDRIETLETKYKELTNELEESKNRSMCKILISKNIKQPQQSESRDQTKLILVNEVLNVMPESDKDFITSKTERAHRAKGNKYGTILPIIAKVADRAFSMQVKSSFIKVAKDKKDEIPIIVLQMYSAALIK